MMVERILSIDLHICKYRTGIATLEIVDCVLQLKVKGKFCQCICVKWLALLKPFFKSKTGNRFVEIGYLPGYLARHVQCNRTVTVPLIPFLVRFGSVFKQKPRLRFSSVFSYLN